MKEDQSTPPNGRLAPSTSGMESAALGHRILFALVALVVCVGPIWSGMIPMTHDGPQHVFMAHLPSVYAADPLLQLLVEPATPVTSLGFSSVFTVFEPALGWQSAFRVALTLIALLSVSGYAAYLNSHPDAPRGLVWLSLAFAFPWSLYMGFLSYTLSLGLGWWILAAHRLGWLDHNRRALALSLGLLLVALSHVFVAGCIGLILLLHETIRALRRRSPRPVIRVVLAGIPAFLVALIVLLWMLPEQSEVYAPENFANLGERLRNVARAWTVGPWWRVLPPNLLGLAGIAAALRWKRKAAAPELLSVTGACVVIFFAPDTFAGWQMFPHRLVPFALGLAIPWVGALPTAPSKIALRAVFAAWLVATTSWPMVFNQRVESIAEGLDEALQADIPTDGKIIGAVILPSSPDAIEYAETMVPRYQPFKNSALLVATAHGGYPANYFGGFPLMHSYVRTDDHDVIVPPLPSMRFSPDYLRSLTDESEFALLTELSAASSRLDRALVLAPQESLSHWDMRGFDRVWSGEDGNVALFSYSGCSVGLSLRAPPRAPSPIIIELSWAPLVVPSFQATISAGSPIPPAETVLPMPDAPCGPVWIRVWMDVDDNGSLTEGDWTCEGAREDARLSLQAVHGEAISIECNLSSPQEPHPETPGD